MTDFKNNLEEAWNQEYRDFMLSFYPESSPFVSTWEVYRMAKIKSQKEIKNLLELTETLNQVRDNLQDENRKLEQELQKTREQLKKAESVLEWYADHENWTCNNLEQIEPSIESSDCYDGDEFGLSEYLTLGGRRAKEYFKEKE